MKNTHLKNIREKGYTVMPAIYSQNEVNRALQIIRDLNEKKSEFTTSNLPRLATDPIIWNLQNKDIYFLKLLFQPREVEEILMDLLNDPWYKAIPQDQPNYNLRLFTARSSKKSLALHIDSFLPYTGNHCFSMQCAVLLEDMNEENGSTLVVPGSHQYGEYARQDALNDAIPVIAKAGDVVLWDSRLWHGALPNDSGKTRWALIATYVRWWVKQSFMIPQNLPESIYDELSDKERAILGYCSIPYNNEMEGIDMRNGYEVLKTPSNA